ncbi:hypothetical protein AAEX28_00215 [Lentisphaerota bacterium WC36G]|nr:hypothetical protein LJT99_03095 [Lentisphaerae bacterium WC36]
MRFQLPLKVFLLIISALIVTLFSANCKLHSEDYYTDKAVTRARKLTLNKMKFLTPNQRSYIQFNKPVVVYSEILTPTSYTEPTQVCLIWHVPNMKKSVVVYGVGSFDLQGWNPDQVLLQEFAYHDKLREKATNAGVKYVMNKMLFLNDKERNNVRFSAPNIYITDFKIDTRVKTIEKDLYAQKQLKKDFKDFQQVSLIWNTADRNKKIVVTGLANKNYGDWTAIEGTVRNKKDIFKHTLKIIQSSLSKTPRNSYEKLLGEEK